MESLAALFYLGGLLAFVAGGAQGNGRLRALSWTCLVGGLLSKSSAITLPAVLLVYDFCFLSGFDLKRV